MPKVNIKLRWALYEKALRNFTQVNLSDENFSQQNDFLKDKSKFISVCCSRRAGKSYGIAKKLLMAAQAFPEALIPYISLTRRSAHNIMYPIFRELNAKYKLCLVFKDHKSEVICPNGSIIQFFGADSSGLNERLRGAKYPIAAIDEAQSYKIDLENLVFDILAPAVSEYNKHDWGQVLLCGTPGPSPSGFFYKTQKQYLNFSRHSWTVFSNPYFPNPQDFLNKILSAKNIKEDNPTIQREFYAKWVKDDQALIYQISEKNIINDYQADVQKDFFVLGFDLGFSPDPTAFTLITYNHKQGYAVVLESYSKSELSVTEVADQINKYVQQYPYIRVTGDLGALGKMIGEEIRKRLNINIIPAKKNAKYSFINLVNDDFKQNRIKILRPKSQELIDELDTIQFDGSELLKREDPRIKNDCADSFLYAWKYCYHYIIEKEEIKLEDQIIEEELERKVKKQRENYFI